MTAPKSSQHRLQLCRQLIMSRAQLHHRRRDRRLCSGADPSAGGVQLRLRLGQRVAGMLQVLGQQADLFTSEPRMHALHKAVPGTVLRDGILFPPHIPAQLVTPLFQPLARLGDRTVFRTKLRLHVDVHGVIGTGRCDHRILRRKRDLQHVRCLHRCHRQCGPHSAQRGIAVRIESRSRQVTVWIRRGSEYPPDQGQRRFKPQAWPQRCVELGIRGQIEPARDLLDHRHAAQHLGLAGHHGVGDRIDPHDALQLTRLVLARVVEHRPGGGVARGELGNGDNGQQRAQQHRRQQEPLAAPQDGKDRGAIQWRHTASVARQARLQTFAPCRCGRLSSSCRLVEHHLSWLTEQAGLPVQPGSASATGLQAPP